MNLIIDIGNTSVKLVCFQDEVIVGEKRIAYEDISEFQTFCSSYNIKKAIVSNVGRYDVPILDELHSMDVEELSFSPMMSGLPIESSYETPETLGADRLAAAIGANFLSPGRNILIIDAGTCITYDLVTSDNIYRGGNISPGPEMRFKAMNQFTSRLPLVGRDGVVTDYGTTTEMALRNGVFTGVRHEIEGYIADFSRKYDDLLVYLTGGISFDLQIMEKNTTFVNKYLVPIGLNRVLMLHDRGL